MVAAGRRIPIYCNHSLICLGVGLIITIDSSNTVKANGFTRYVHFVCQCLKGVYNRDVVGVRIERAPPGATDALHQFYCALAARRSFIYMFVYSFACLFVYLCLSSQARG